jgi:LmbE family N-acetylglucosaminyl deacetylase
MEPATAGVSARVLFVIGASGAGKTAAVRALEQRGLPAVRCYYFDTIGVPSPEEMERRWGGGDRWQEDATRRWIERLIRETSPTAVSVLDGQTRPAFILPHMTAAGATCRIVLFDCTPAVRATRLRDGRSQPELVTEQMENWAAYLRREAGALGLPVVETSQLSIDAVADALQHEVDVLL